MSASAASSNSAYLYIFARREGFLSWENVIRLLIIWIRRDRAFLLVNVSASGLKKVSVIRLYSALENMGFRGFYLFLSGSAEVVAEF
jgi:hypothetical protein